VEKIESLIAPHIIGNEEVKKAIALQLFARPEIGEKLHILLIGAAAAGKSELLIDVTRLSDAKYATSKVSKAGFAGAIIGSTFIPGILSECDKQIVCIDELDKIKDDELSVLLEALQKGTSTIIKARHHESVESRINALAAANPHGGGWKNLPRVSEIPFEMPLLSRFHIIAPYKGLPGSMYHRIARGIEYKFKNFYSKDSSKRGEYIKSVVAHAKENVPVVEVDDRLVDQLGYWVGKLKDDSSFAMPVTPRMIEGMLAMIRARARMRLKSRASDEDLSYVKRIILTILGKWNF